MISIITVYVKETVKTSENMEVDMWRRGKGGKIRKNEIRFRTS